MEMMDKLKNDMLNYIRIYDISNVDVSDLSFDELLKYYVISLGINIIVFDEFIKYWCKLINIEVDKDTILLNMEEYNLLDPYNLIGEVISYINSYEPYHEENLRYYEGQIESDEENIKDSSIPFRQSEAYSDLAYSKLQYHQENCYWQLCQSTIEYTSVMLKKIQENTITRKKVDY